ncbi:MAG: efflux RND transporter periplasmic adaptor subunit [Acidobacteriota bacterium]
MKRIVVIVVALAVIVAGIAVIRHKKAALANLTPPANPAVPVRVATVREGAVGDRITTVALIQAETSATLAAQVGGALLDVRFREGDAVRKGDVMARIDARVLDDAVATAQARVSATQEDLVKQQAIFARDQVLFDNQAISKQALDGSKAQLEAVRAASVGAARALDSARTMRSYAEVTALYSGTVTARLVEPGDLATPGKPLFALQVPGPVKVISKLAQDTLGSLAVGGTVTFENGGQTLTAKVSRIYPALDLAHLGTVETDLPSAPFGLAPGATISASYQATASPGLLVPISALLAGLDQTLVVRVTKGHADPVPVTVVGNNGSEATITGALHAGDEVVTGLPSELMALTAGTALAPQRR